MGTDIHAFAELRGPGGWEPCYQRTLAEEGERQFLRFYCGQERNYELFAVLAGVRRLTNDGFAPIRPPRGLPADLSPALRSVAESPHGLWGHNYTWLTLRELLEYPWQGMRRTIRLHVDADGFREFQEHGRPERGHSIFCAESVCGTDPEAGKRPILISNEEMARRLKQGEDTGRRVTEVAFEQPVAPYCHDFVVETLPLLGTLGKPDDVRIILWFDS